MPGDVARRAKGDFKGRHFEATLILQAVSGCLRYPHGVTQWAMLERLLADAERATLNALSPTEQVDYLDKRHPLRGNEPGPELRHDHRPLER